MRSLLLPLLLLSTTWYAGCLDRRIIGGVDTTIQQHPYQVSIHYKGELKCGGSIISRKWVLTAAHCVYGERPANFQIRIQSTYYNTGGKLISDISRIIWHERYDDETFEFDVALMELSTALASSAEASPVSLAQSTTVVQAGSPATVTGWGKTSVNGPMSNTLKALTAPVVDQNTCKKIYGANHEVTSVMLCAGVLTGGKDTCQGDSGGPLVYNGVQIGIVSWGVGCAKAGYPGVYTRLSEVRNWINTKAGV